jgi:hypothetical protein
MLLGYQLRAKFLASDVSAGGPARDASSYGSGSKEMPPRAPSFPRFFAERLRNLAGNLTGRIDNDARRQVSSLDRSFRTLSCFSLIIFSLQKPSHNGKD